MMLDIESKNEAERLTTQDYWQSQSSFAKFKRHEKGHGIDTFIRKYIPSVVDGSVLEIGSFPGSHLPTFGDLGYQVNGIDFCVENGTAVPAWLQKEGCKTGTFWVADFFEFSPSHQFDVVCSFGFIEHFEEFEKVILKHSSLVKDNGYILITTPNFKGVIQQLLHRYFDKNNLALHNLKSMQPALWAKLLEQNGYTVIYKGYFGGFWFWRGHEEFGRVKKGLLWLIERMIPRMRRLLPLEAKAYSAYCGIVAKKIK